MRKFTLVLLLALAIPALAQYSIMPDPKPQFLDATGIPLAGGKLCTYQAGTSTPLATYTDSTGGTLNSNPVILDSAGRALVWLGPSYYKIVLYSAGTDTTCNTGTLQWSVDNVSGSARLSSPQLSNPTVIGAITPLTAGTADLGSTTLPFGNLWVGAATTNNAKITGTFSAARVFTVPDVASDTFVMLGATQTLPNKTLTSPTISDSTTTGTDSGAETLKNKALNGAGNGNAVTLVCVSGPAAEITGDATDHTLLTCSIPANVIGAGKGIRITSVWQHTTGTASVTYNARLNSTNLASFSTADGSFATSSRWAFTIFNAAGVQNSQFWEYTDFVNSTTWLAGAGVGTASENLANSATFTITFNVAATDKVTPKAIFGELIQ